ncbi:unnamed protein product [Cuscuta europaea]|uniref:Uncharacterized protein n=1 Tax=Cuscuta europaea TaxID=41803 RepID=A0A9P1E026_CUSEU|nr:unnamed protein product [Cuscuta europaea]
MIVDLGFSRCELESFAMCHQLEVPARYNPPPVPLLTHLLLHRMVYTVSNRPGAMAAVTPSVVAMKVASNRAYISEARHKCDGKEGISKVFHLRFYRSKPLSTINGR